MKPKKTSYNPGDSILNHKAEYTFRGAWSSSHNKLPAGMIGVQAVREQPRDTKYILVPAAEYEKFGWTVVLKPDNYEEWKR